MQITAKQSWGKLFNPVTRKYVDVAVGPITYGGYFVYNLQRREVLNSQLKFEFGTLKAILGKSLPVGTITIPVQTFINLIEGNIDINELLQLIPNPLPQVYRRVPSDEYRTIKGSYEKKYGALNVYFASKGFVDWANPCEKAGTWGVELIVTGGAAASLIMKQVESELRKEGNGILDWLRRRGEQHAENLLVTLLSGGRFTWPYLAAVWQPIKYKVTHMLFGRPAKTFVCNHAGFVLIWDWGKTQGLDDLLAQKKMELYTDLTNEIFQQLYHRNPTAAELTKGVTGFIQNGTSYANQIFTDAAKQIYQEIYGQGVLPAPAELAQARAAFASGLSYADVRAKVEATRLAILRKERAIQFLFNQYIITGF